MRSTFRVSLLLLLFSGVISCASGHSPKNKNLNIEIETGKIVSPVSCLGNPGITYSVYLPKAYTEKRSFPIILAFDPSGIGTQPLTFYSSLAEKYGYIMVGSNDSKNGNSLSQAENIIRSMLQEIRLRFSIDTTRIYAMGFSGGARVSCMAGLYIGGIAGVTGCGAGFPGIDHPGFYKFDYIGFAGLNDFNMNELIKLNEKLSKDGSNHALFLFDGIHEWPAPSLMEKAFQWNECCAMRKHSIPVNEKLIGTVQHEFDSLFVKDKDAGDRLGYHRDLENILSFLKDLSETKSYQQQLSELENSAEYKKEKAKQMKSMEDETLEQQMYSDYFFFKNLGLVEGQSCLV